MIRSALVFCLLVSLKLVSRFFFRPRMRFAGDVPARPWRRIRVVAFLNHTSLYEPVFTAGVPLEFLWRLSRHGVVPAASKTIERPLVGLLFRFIARHVVSISRERDHTWAAVLQRIEPDSMVVIAPEGRMKRASGLDSHGNPMTVRGGIADILEVVPEGRMLIAYSGGLHHVQIPGERLPRLFQPVGMLIEVVDIADYRRLMQSGADNGLEFKRAVVADLERRRDTYCPRAAALAGQDWK
jgi:hypothetical protein